MEAPVAGNAKVVVPEIQHKPRKLNAPIPGINLPFHDGMRVMNEKKTIRETKLGVLRLAAKEGFDEIDQGKGVVLKGKQAIIQFQ